ACVLRRYSTPRTVAASIFCWSSPGMVFCCVTTVTTGSAGMTASPSFLTSGFLPASPLAELSLPTIRSCSSADFLPPSFFGATAGGGAHDGTAATAAGSGFGAAGGGRGATLTGAGGGSGAAVPTSVTNVALQMRHGTVEPAGIAWPKLSSEWQYGQVS